MANYFGMRSSVGPGSFSGLNLMRFYYSHSLPCVPSTVLPQAGHPKRDDHTPAKCRPDVSAGHDRNSAGHSTSASILSIFRTDPSKRRFFRD